MKTKANFRLTAVAVMVVLSVCGSTRAEEVVYVDADAIGTNDGSSWINAFADLQDGIDAVVSNPVYTGAEVWVAQGTYKPTNRRYSGEPQSVAFNLRDGVMVYGGFNGTESTQSERDWINNETILSGDIDDDGVLNANNAWHVVEADTEDVSPTGGIDGFTVTGGYADGLSPENNGGGLYIQHESPTITNCRIIDNYAYNNGGGMYINNSVSTINTCTFTGNSAYDGGGVYVGNASNPTFSNCAFTGNFGQHGSGIFCDRSNLTVQSSIFYNNLGSHVSGIQCSNGSQATITNCSFSGGESTAIKCEYGSGATISKCRIYGIYGTATHHAPPAIWIEDSIDSTTINNCLIYRNYSTRWAAGIWCTRSNPTISNCTIFGNSCGEGTGGGIGCYDGEPIITNCILWGNESPNGLQIALKAGSNLFVSNCDVEGGIGEVLLEDSSINWGEGNIDTDPLFVDTNGPDGIAGTEDDNLQLSENSSCIDAGDPNYIAEPNETDLDGNPRVTNNRIDMGAFEFQPLTPVELLLDLTDYVDELGLHKSIANSLFAKLGTAMRLLEDDNENNDTAAINSLRAFINAIDAQRGRKILETDADALINTAQEIIELLTAG